jgi:hypothetical protein
MIVAHRLSSWGISNPGLTALLVAEFCALVCLPLGLLLAAQRKML